MRFLFVALALSVSASQALAEQLPNAVVSVCFTPAEQCEVRIVEAIDKAQSSMRVQAYGFTSLPIIHALQRAARREVEVLAILDKVNERKYSGATLLEAAGVPVWIDFEPAIAHNKILVINDRLVSAAPIISHGPRKSETRRRSPSRRALRSRASSSIIGKRGSRFRVCSKA